MKIKKTFQGSIPENKILNSNSTSQTDTYSCEKINEMTEEIYSTEEQVIGKWTDGKPLYRKVVSVSGHPSQISHGISNLKKVICMRGFVSRSSDVVKSQNLPHADININYVIDANYVSDSLIYMEYGSEIINNITEVTWILEYTKTTD